MVIPNSNNIFEQMLFDDGVTNDLELYASGGGMFKVRKQIMLEAAPGMKADIQHGSKSGDIEDFVDLGTDYETAKHFIRFCYGLELPFPEPSDMSKDDLDVVLDLSNLALSYKAEELCDWAARSMKQALQVELEVSDVLDLGLRMAETYSSDEIDGRVWDPIIGKVADNLEDISEDKGLWDTFATSEHLRRNVLRYVLRGSEQYVPVD